MTYFKNKTVIMSGGSRGVGLEIAKALGKDGANIAILAKTTEPHPTLPGTIFTAAEEIEEVGGNYYEKIGEALLGGDSQLLSEKNSTEETQF